MGKEKTKRHQARVAAFQVLYSLSFTQAPTEDDVKNSYLAIPTNEDNPQEETKETSGFAWELVHGVWSQCQAIDARIQERLTNWRIERLGTIERTLLRLAFFELFFLHQTPPKVIMAETLDLCKEFAEPSAKKFIHGILEAAMKQES
ncbi:MAG: transcription antitermination factor NusB [Desulfovibrio sp.]|nr:transcription antitermination factor NusB [Desulfovibrio sp.]